MLSLERHGVATDICAYRVEEYDPDGIVRPNKHFLLLNLHRCLQCDHKVACLHVLIALVVTHLEHGGRAVDAEENHVAFAFVKLNEVNGCFSVSYKWRTYGWVLQLLVLVVVLVPVVVRRHACFRGGVLALSGLYGVQFYLESR